MRALAPASALGLALLASCAPGDTWSSRVPEPREIRDNPEIYSEDTIFKFALGSPFVEQLFRKPADFRIYDPHTQKEFFLYRYQDDSVNDDVIFVINHAIPEGARRPRLATAEESTFAMSLFIADWKAHGQEERVRYFNRRVDEEDYRKSTQLDDQIAHKIEEKKWWDTQVLNLESDLASRQATSAYAGGDEKFNLSDTGKTQALLGHAKRMQALSETQLWILRYRKYIRDSQYAHGTVDHVESAMRVEDLVAGLGGPDKLIAEVRTHVEPFAWGMPETRLYVAQGQLVVCHTRDIVLMVRDYVDALREQVRAKLRQSQIVPSKP